MIYHWTRANGTTIMTKPHLLQLGPYPDWDQAPLDAAFTMHKLFEADDPDTFLAEIGSDIRGIAARGTHKVPRDMIESCPNLEIISVYGVGYDGVDLDACRDHRIRVTNTPDVLTGDVADLGIAMMLMQSRNMLAAEHHARSGAWGKGGFPLTKRVYGARVGILGLGRIGFAVAKRCAAFDMQIHYTDLEPRDDASNWTFQANPTDLASAVDFLFVTLTASAETKHIVNADVLNALGPDGMIINISRASNIDENALLNALETGRIGGAALDVFDGEPNINPRFLPLNNVLLQPHHASGTVETRKAMGQMMRDNLTAHFQGLTLPNPVL